MFLMCSKNKKKLLCPCYSERSFTFFSPLFHLHSRSMRLVWIRKIVSANTLTSSFHLTSSFWPASALLHSEVPVQLQTRAFPSEWDLKIIFDNTAAFSRSCYPPSSPISSPLFLVSSSPSNMQAQVFAQLHGASHLRTDNWKITCHKVRVSSILLTCSFCENLYWLNQQEGIKAKSEYL